MRYRILTASNYDCGVYNGASHADALLTWALDTGYANLAAALEVNPGVRSCGGDIEYRRVQHAAHQLGGAPGWDLEEWHARQQYDAPRPDEVPRDANKSHGYIKDGAQFVIYTRRAPFTGTRCRICDAHSGLKQ